MLKEDFSRVVYQNKSFHIGRTTDKILKFKKEKVGNIRYMYKYCVLYHVFKWGKMIPRPRFCENQT